MGIIVRQSLKQTFVSLAAVGLAFVAHIFIYTIDESATYGEASRIMAIVALLAPILLFGIPQSLIKFHGEFSDGRKGYLANFLFACIPFGAVFFLIYFIFNTHIFNLFTWLGFDTTLFIDYGPQMALLIITLMLFKVIAAYLSTQKRIVWPSIFDNLWTKFALGLLVYLIIFNYIPSTILSWGLVSYYGIALVAIVIYAIVLGKFDLTWNSELFKGDNLRRISNYSGYTGLSAFGANFASRIDVVMVAALVPATMSTTQDQFTGVYNLFLFLAGVVDVPSRAVAQISAPIISQANDRGDKKEIKLIYSKSASTLFLVALSVFALILLSIDDLFMMTGRNAFYRDYFVIFTILGATKLVSATLSNVNLVILYSEYYRYSLYLTLFMGVSNVVLNYYFITDVYQEAPLTGVAIATSMALIFQYLVKVIFVRIKFGMHPFNWKMLLSVGSTLACFALAYIIPSIELANFNFVINAFLSIILRTLVFSIPFAYLVYTFKVSEDLNSLWDQLITRIKTRDLKNLI